MGFKKYAHVKSLDLGLLFHIFFWIIVDSGGSQKSDDPLQVSGYDVFIMIIGFGVFKVYLVLVFEYSKL